MPGRLLDTNAVIGLQRGDARLTTLLNQDVEWFLSAVVLGELYYGAYRSAQVEKNVAAIDHLAADVRVLPSDAATARIFGQIHQSLRSKGRPIPEDDIWIAAVALQHDLTLVTRDGHFEHVEHLRTVNWQ